MSTAHLKVLLAPWQLRRSRGELWSLAVVGLALLSLPVFFITIAAETRRVEAGLLSALAVLGLVLLAAWPMLVSNLLLQNDPHCARLVPGHTRVLRQAAWGVAGVLVAGATLTSVALGGPAWPVALGSTVFLVGIALGVRWPVLFFVPAVAGWTAPWWSRSPLVEALWGTASPWLGAAFLALAAWALGSVVMNGGARHERTHQRLLKVSRVMRGKAPERGGAALVGTGWAWTVRLGLHGYHRWLVRVLGRPNTPVQTRLALGLGPQAHWTGVLAAHLAGPLFALLALVVARCLPDQGLGQALAAGVVVGASMASSVVVVSQLPAALWASRREQALLRLLPGAPQGAALNRWLAQELTLAGLAALPLQAATVALAVLAFPQAELMGVNGPELAVGLLALNGLLLPSLWRDWACMRQPGGGAQLWLLAVTCVGPMAVIAWLQWQPHGWPAFVALCGALLVPLVAWRWRAVAQMPGAWPVGRQDPDTR